MIILNSFFSLVLWSGILLLLLLIYVIRLISKSKPQRVQRIILFLITGILFAVICTDLFIPLYVITDPKMVYYPAHTQANYINPFGRLIKDFHSLGFRDFIVSNVSHYVRWLVEYSVIGFVVSIYKKRKASMALIVVFAFAAELFPYIYGKMIGLNYQSASAEDFLLFLAGGALGTVFYKWVERITRKYQEDSILLSGIRNLLNIYTH